MEVPQLNCNCMNLPSKLSIRGSACGKLAEIYGQSESGGTIVSQWFALRICLWKNVLTCDISLYSFEIFLPETICLLRQPAHKHMYLWHLFTFLKYYMRFLNLRILDWNQIKMYTICSYLRLICMYFNGTFMQCSFNNLYIYNIYIVES